MSPVDSSPPIDLEDLIDNRTVGRFHALVLALTGSVMFLDGLDTQAVSYIAPVRHGSGVCRSLRSARCSPRRSSDR
ncbi:hypothetical protein ACFQH9_20250 [Pseudonocardia lutea]|uniref:Major facilitator superfamily (MFS) profile domain-containing protein n=1 Tax=Pseudonocardia lutea TaxID=2172015 RepID=A0ABW1IB48_9PSEU